MAVKFRDYIRGLPSMDITADALPTIVEGLFGHLDYIGTNLFDATMAILAATEGVPSIFRGRILWGVIESLQLTPVQSRELFKYKPFANVMFSIGKTGDFRSPHHFTACPAAFLSDFLKQPEGTPLPGKLLESSLAKDARPLIAAGMPLQMAKTMLPGAFTFADYETTLSQKKNEFKEVVRILPLIPCVANRIFRPDQHVSARNPRTIPAIAIITKNILDYFSSCKLVRQEIPERFDHVFMRPREDRNGHLSAVMFLPKDSLVALCTQELVAVPEGYFKSARQAFRIKIKKGTCLGKHPRDESVPF